MDRPIATTRDNMRVLWLWNGWAPMVYTHGCASTHGKRLRSCKTSPLKGTHALSRVYTPTRIHTHIYIHIHTYTCLSLTIQGLFKSFIWAVLRRKTIMYPVGGSHVCRRMGGRCHVSPRRCFRRTSDEYTWERHLFFRGHNRYSGGPFKCCHSRVACV